MKRIVLTIFVLCAFASCLFAQQTEGEDIVAEGYPQCPDPYAFCAASGSIPTAGCKFEDCFEMNYSAVSGIRVAVVDEFGDFPKMWFMWQQKNQEGTIIPIGNPPCEVTERGSKTLLEIPETSLLARCKVDLSTGGQVYHEHFVSNPASGCLAWLECMPVAAPTP